MLYKPRVSKLYNEVLDLENRGFNAATIAALLRKSKQSFKRILKKIESLHATEPSEIFQGNEPE